MPGLTGNPLAIIVATPLGDTELLNPQPIGAWYYSGKWTIANMNDARMPVGAKYKIQFFQKPGANQFLHLITQQNIGGEGSYIDHPSLNNQPNAQVQILQNHAPEVRSPYNRNRFKAQAAYSAAAGKWYIASINDEPLGRGSAYNVVVGSGGSIGINPPSGGTSHTNPASLPPSGNAGGDLNGTYPNPTVQKLVGKPLSNVAPAVGQILRWNGTAWEPASETSGGNSGDAKTYNAGSGLSLSGTTFIAQNTTAMWNANQLAGKEVAVTAPTTGQVLKWNGSAWTPADAGASPQTDSSGAKTSVLHFPQSAMVQMQSGDENTLIPGLDNQAFTVPQSSRIVHHTVIEIQFYGTSAADNFVNVRVEILDASNAVRSRARITEIPPINGSYRTITLTNFGVLPAGTYRTKVSLTKNAGATLTILNSGQYGDNQDGRMIIQIFPD